jgi:hypothetical protein
METSSALLKTLPLVGPSLVPVGVGETHWWLVLNVLSCTSLSCTLVQFPSTFLSICLSWVSWHCSGHNKLIPRSFVCYNIHRRFLGLTRICIILVRKPIPRNLEIPRCHHNDTLPPPFEGVLSHRTMRVTHTQHVRQEKSSKNYQRQPDSRVKEVREKKVFVWTTWPYFSPSGWGPCPGGSHNTTLPPKCPFPR